MMLRRALCWFATGWVLFAGETGGKHVVVIGIDGLSPRGIEMADTPHIDALVASGAHTWKARGVFPTKSSPNWASMIMGAGPEQHGGHFQRLGARRP